jgi:hypothetical protein
MYECERLRLIQNLLPLMPRRLGAAGTAPILAAVAFGCALWVIGARFSRPMLSMLATLGGALIGFQFPSWLGWGIDPWSVAMLFGLIFGVVAFAFHRWAATLSLGLVMALWGGLGAIAAVGWKDQIPSGGIFTLEFIRSCLVTTNDAPPDFSRQVLLVAASIGMMGGFTLAMIWQRVGLAMLWSMIGLTLVLMPALSAAEQGGSAGRIIQMIPRQAAGQAVTLLALVVIGALVQLNFSFPLAAQQPDEEEKMEKKETQVLIKGM